ncbi:MAG: hypothetical protein K2K77_04170 [Duncaniella sp.]|nr:hypothetical protein [Duncaniella sp.]
MDNIQIIERLVADGKLHEAVERLGVMLAETTSADGREDACAIADLYFRRGKLSWRLGNRAAATSDYAHAAALDPTSPAVKALEQAVAVADFFNPDLYNP